MITETVYKATRLGRDGVTPDGTLQMRDEFPDYRCSLEVVREHFEMDAHAIMRVLTGCLPQGTLDQLLILLLKDRACLFAIGVEGRLDQ